MRPIVTFTAAAMLIAVAAPALAVESPPTIAVSGTGSVEFSPNIAHLSLGVRGESTTASAAAKSVNKRAQTVVEAMRKLGIADRDIKTTGYTISFQPPDTGGVSPVQTMSVARKPVPKNGTYVTTESLDVTTSLDKAGAALDAGIQAGANETYGLSFDTSERQSLYRQALAKAVADARELASILAQSAGVEIAGIQSIRVGGEGPTPMARGVMMADAAAPVMGGTDTVTATVEVVYKIK